MKERPILFNSPMVRALLDGSKTQTRRVVKHQPPEETWNVFTGLYHPTVIDKHGDQQPGSETFGAWSADGEWATRCPYGQPGDQLWVREAWRVDQSLDPFNAEGIKERSNIPGIWIEYESDSEKQLTAPGRYRHARFMPRWASRITLEVTGVRVERLLDISEADAMAEGAMLSEGPCTEPEFQSYTLGYLNLWGSINGPGSWNANPWVWVLEFKVVTL